MGDDPTSESGETSEHQSPQAPAPPGRHKYFITEIPSPPVHDLAEEARVIELIKAYAGQTRSAKESLICPFCIDEAGSCDHLVAKFLNEQPLQLEVASAPDDDLAAAILALIHGATAFEAALEQLGFDEVTPAQYFLSRTNYLERYYRRGISVDLVFRTNNGKLEIVPIDLLSGSLPSGAKVVSDGGRLAIFAQEPLEARASWISALSELADELMGLASLKDEIRWGALCPICSAPYIEHSEEWDGPNCDHLLFEWLSEGEDDIEAEDDTAAIYDLRVAAARVERLMKHLELSAEQTQQIIDSVARPMDSRWAPAIFAAIVAGKRAVDQIVVSIVESVPGCVTDHRTPGDDHPGGGVVMNLAWAADTTNAMRTTQQALDQAAEDYDQVANRIQTLARRPHVEESADEG